MINIVAEATVFLNALDRIPKLMEQYRMENEKLEKDLPTLREVVGGMWKKEMFDRYFIFTKWLLIAIRKNW